MAMRGNKRREKYLAIAGDQRWQRDRERLASVEWDGDSAAVCSKRAYRSKGDAKVQLKELQAMRRQGEGERSEQAVYRCPRCQWWHLTSQRKTENRRDVAVVVDRD